MNREFKVGDQVKVSEIIDGDEGDNIKKYLGRIGVISWINHNDDYPFKVEFPLSDPAEYPAEAFYGEELELFEEFSTSRQPTLKDYLEVHR